MVSSVSWWRLCVLLMCETGMKSDIMLCSKIRKTAFRFLTYKGPECFAAAATMMATTKEAKMMCQLLRKICSENDGPFVSSVYTRNRTFGAMIRICEECSAVEGSTGGSTATKLIFDESDDKNPSEKELVNKDKQRNKINNNTKRGLGKLDEAVKQQMAEVIAALQVVQKPVEQEQLTKDKFELAPKFQEVLLRHKADILARQNEMEKSLSYQCRKLDTMFLQKQNHLEQQMQERLNLMEEMNLTKHNEIIQRFDTVAPAKEEEPPKKDEPKFQAFSGKSYSLKR
ncbi:uncharacterized protein C2845_PM15G19280 [Panicum miliaceum]|uniref:Uncharacterized protein n=1 Tax=Panicum miliaceum TaxID=4540 RepID=A0A3L6Q9L0_PANMI|nr:uncharacterized protein C2845_PM15G19280 [Panicum miliaceum]